MKINLKLLLSFAFLLSTSALALSTPDRGVSCLEAICEIPEALDAPALSLSELRVAVAERLKSLPTNEPEFKKRSNQASMNVWTCPEITFH